MAKSDFLHKVSAAEILEIVLKTFFLGQKNSFGFVFFWAETVAISCELKLCFFFRVLNLLSYLLK